MAACDVEGAMALFGCAWITFFSVGVALRSKLRSMKNIGGTFCGDLCTWMWCGPFAAYQEYQALAEGQFRPWGMSIGNTKVVENPEPGSPEVVKYNAAMDNSAYGDANL